MQQYDTGSTPYVPRRLGLLVFRYVVVRDSDRRTRKLASRDICQISRLRRHFLPMRAKKSVKLTRIGQAGNIEGRTRIRKSSHDLLARLAQQLAGFGED